MVLAAPRDGDELADLLKTALEHDQGPFAIRYPKDSSLAWSPAREPRALPIGSWTELARGEGVAVLAVGSMVGLAQRVLDRLAEGGLSLGLVNCRFVKPLDDDLLSSLARRYAALVTLEEGVLCGGFGSAVYEGLRQSGPRLPRLLHLGLPDRYIEHGTREQQLQQAGLGAAQIEDRLRELWRSLE